MIDVKQLHLIRNIRKQLVKRDKNCLNKSCSQPAINSHLLQRNGILNFIATNGNIIQLSSDVDFDATAFRFQKRRVGKAETLTYKVFCPNCDNKLFEPIEKITPDFTEYRTQMLFSYRAFLRELGAIKFGLDFYSECIACKDLDPQIKARLAPMKKNYQLVLHTYNYFSALFDKDLGQKRRIPFTSFTWPRNHFKFHTFEIPKIEVAASALFSYEHDLSITKDEYNLRKPLTKNNASKTKPFFINIIPRENSSVIIVGYAKGASRIENWSVNQIDQLSRKDLLKLVSDILVKRIDNWCISFRFYEFMKRTGGDQKVVDFKHSYFFHPTSEQILIKEMEIEFNLFQDFLA
jgi:hypothetical protein